MLAVVVFTKFESSVVVARTTLVPSLLICPFVGERPVGGALQQPIQRKFLQWRQPHQDIVGHPAEQVGQPRVGEAGLHLADAGGQHADTGVPARGRSQRATVRSSRTPAGRR